MGQSRRALLERCRSYNDRGCAHRVAEHANRARRQCARKSREALRVANLTDVRTERQLCGFC